MRKHTTLDLDHVLLHEAAVALGTIRVTETVHAALAEVVARRRRAMLARLDLPDLTPDRLAAMRTPRQSGALEAESATGTGAPDSSRES
jgi:hypothetical protein